MNKQVTSKNQRYAALYCRVSTDAQFEDGYSIDAQKELLQAYCKSRQITNYKIFVDGGYSGSNLNRPAIQEVIEDSKQGKISTVVVYKLDRISRSQKDTLYLIEDVFLPNEVDFISMNESFDTSSPFGRAMVGILSVFAQLERDNIKLRTRMGMKKRVEEGYWMGGGIVPYGYDYDANQGILVKNGESDNVRKMYELYLEGYSCERIAKMFDLKYDKLVYQILTRKSNTGIISYNGEEYQGKHEPIIDLETYERTINEMKKRAEKRFTTKTQHLLTGLLYCGKCGAKMRYQKWGKIGYKIYCYSQQKSKDYLIKDPNCNNLKNWSWEIEEAVINDLLTHVSIGRNSKVKNDNSSASALSLLQDKKKDLNKQIKNLYILFANDPNETLKGLIDERNVELQEIEKLIEMEKEKKDVIAENQRMIQELSTLTETWEFMSTEEKRQILFGCIEKILVVDNRVEVYYKL